MVNLFSLNPAQTIILAGSGRSGTTWVGNVLAAAPTMRIIFEPFDRRRVPEAADIPLFPYLRPHAAPPWGTVVNLVLRGQLRNPWVLQDGDRWWGWRGLVKSIRAGGMLAWIDRHFAPPIVYMLRHPCAVILSRMRLGWETHLDVFLAQPDLINDYLDSYLDLIHGARTEIERQAVQWALENIVVLRQREAHRWTLLTYEEFYTNPEAEAERVLHCLGLRKSWFTHRAMQRITQVTRPDSPLHQGKSPLLDWQAHLAPAEIETILRTAHAFGITLYDAGPLPATPLATAPWRGIPQGPAPLATPSKS